MGLAFLIVGGALVAWGVLLVLGLLVMLLLFSRTWPPQQERSIMLLLQLFRPMIFTLNPLERLIERLRFVPRGQRSVPWLLFGVGGICIALGLLLNALLR